MSPDDLDLNPNRPTVLFFRAPWCGQCQAMEPALEAAAVEYRGSVDLMPINVAEEADLTQSFGVRGTPTVIGLVDGSPEYRHTGRLSLGELREVFEALGRGGRPAASNRRELMLRVGVGVVLSGLGLISGPAWPLVGIGAGVAAVGALATHRGAG